MESHAHHIHKAPGQGWKHYFFDFLMLFLAVFCGFLAENIRERGVERKKEKEYMRSLWLDLQEDTSSLRDISSRFAQSNRSIDTLIRLLKSSYKSDSSCKIYRLAMTIPFADRIPQPDNKTFEQLKNSGNLRLIHNNELLSKIGAYYNRYNQMVVGGPGQMLFQNRHDLYLFTYELFDMAVFQKLWQTSQTTGRGPIIIDSCAEKPGLLTNDPMVINKICARYFYIEMTRKILSQFWVDTSLSQANSLLATLKEQYHFKN